jgi:hypothetical protein
VTLPELFTDPLHTDLKPPIRLERTRDGESCGQGGAGKWFTIATFVAVPNELALEDAFGGGNFRLVDSEGQKRILHLLGPVKPVAAMRDSFKRGRETEAAAVASVGLVAELRAELTSVRAELAKIRDRAAELERSDAERERDFEALRQEYADELARAEVARENPPADPMVTLLSQIEAFGNTQKRLAALASVLAPTPPARPSLLEIAGPQLLKDLGPTLAGMLGKLGGAAGLAPAPSIAVAGPKGKVLQHDWSELEAHGISPQEVLDLASQLATAAPVSVAA